MDTTVTLLILAIVVASVVGMRQAYRAGVADGYKKAMRLRVLWRGVRDNGHTKKSG